MAIVTSLGGGLLSFIWYILVGMWLLNLVRLNKAIPASGK
jgi:uncharacterized membrane protein YccF (DUF307 family)